MVIDGVLGILIASTISISLGSEEMVLFVVGEHKQADIFKKHENIIADLKARSTKG